MKFNGKEISPVTINGNKYKKPFKGSKDINQGTSKSNFRKALYIMPDTGEKVYKEHFVGSFPGHGRKIHASFNRMIRG